MEHINYFLANYGYFAIFGLLMLGIVGPLIPDETILVLAGIAVHNGQLSFLPAIASGCAGSLCGITLSYLLGRSGAIFIIERFAWLNRHLGRHLPKADVWFRRYGAWTLFFGYFIAGLRHFTALAAGMSKLSFRTFATWAWPGGIVWVICFISIGYFLGDQWQHFGHLLDRGILIAAVAIAIVALTVWLLRRGKSPAA